ncbi:multicopper oxidase family protein [Thermomonospora umbrina]|uniref:FtsP/CotA-like multicopper oxidase with cupredoxin domain n=1 Tax=Thermomonospora umbrina TaxID=111806 RepID=A0A3D9STV1_9ACTN|nr:multicopper oxidase domain-containing protein [Thermomonospora umbrina]REE99037.1 FtsP/CotA-like multicopper oxidase with cupredoxin domain [Thermomonospora umbrina]
MLNRRDSLKLGAVAGAAMLVPAGRLSAVFADDEGTASTPFTRALPIPPVLRPVSSTADHDLYDMTLAPTTASILPGLQTPLLTFNGSFPGPTIRARRGRASKVRVTNRMTTPSSVHLHGADVAPSSDGHPVDLIQPGESKIYHYPNRQPAATLWYHDHAHHIEAEQVYRGLAGLYLIGDAESDALGLPGGQYDIPLFIRDAAFDEQGRLLFTLDDFASRRVVLVNGAHQPFVQVRRRKYRLRLVNAANSRPIRLVLSDGGEFVRIASDGGLLEHPVRGTSIELWPAERAEVVVDFTNHATGSTLYLENVFNGPETPNRQLLQFQVGEPVPDPSRVPDTLRTHPDLGEPILTRTINMGRDATNTFYAINGLPYDPDRIDFRCKRGSTELWVVNNTDGQYNFPHSMHVHLVQFRVLDRNGVPVGPEEAYPKDTVRIPAGQTVRMLVRFESPFTGVYPYHCHFLDHSSAHMMAQLEVVP